MKPLYRVLFFFSFAALYFALSFQKVPFGDSLGYVNLAETSRFTLNTTVFGKFLYTNFLVFFKDISGFDSILAAKWFSIIFAVLTLVVIFKITLFKYKKEWLAYAVSLIFGLSFTFWKQAEIVEVYTFNSFFIAVYLLFSLSFLRYRHSQDLLLCSVVLGISLYAHIQNIMMIPGWLLLVFSHYRWQKKASIFSVLIFAALFSGLFITAYFTGNALNRVMSSGNSNWVQGSFTKGFGGYLLDLAKAILYLIYNFWIFALVGLFGFYKLMKEQNKYTWFLFFSFATPFGFATIYNVSDNYVFFLNSYLVFTLFIAKPLYHWQKRSSIISKIAISLSVLPPLFYLLSFLVVCKLPQGKNFEKEKAFKGGLQYYLLPWMHENKGVLHYYLDPHLSEDKKDYMYNNCMEFLELRLHKNSVEEIREM